MNEPWIYIVLIGAVIIVLSRLLPKSPKSSADFVKEVEATIDNFAAELEMDNERLLQSLAKMKEDHHDQLQKLERRIGQLNDRNEWLTEQVEQLQQAVNGLTAKRQANSAINEIRLEAVAGGSVEPDKSVESGESSESSESGDSSESRELVQPAGKVDAPGSGSILRKTANEGANEKNNEEKNEEKNNEESNEAATEGMNLKQRYPELFALYEQGKSIEMIARKIGMNKGEVNLIVQLSKQEENNDERVQA